MSGRVLAIASRPRPAADMALSPEIEIEADGVAGEKRRPKHCQVTLLGREGWDAALTELGVDLPWTTRRSNFLIEGLPLAETTGRRIRVGEALLEVTEETAPCALMDRFHQGLRKALGPDWRGGATLRIVEPGRVAVGDAVEFEDAD